MIYLWVTLGMLAVCAMKHLDVVGLRWYPDRFSPDGLQYMGVAQGSNVARPYCLRWLLPRLIGPGINRRPVWSVVSWMSTLALAPLLVWYLRGCTGAERLFGVGLLTGLNGITKVAIAIPVLVDPVAHALALLGACMICKPLVDSRQSLLAACGVSLVSGAVRETAPVFMATASWSWWPLVGLLAPLIRWWQVRGREAGYVSDGDGRTGFTEVGAKALMSPLPGVVANNGEWFSAKTMLLPWGVCLLAVWQADVRLGVTAAVAYGQLLMAVDRTRLFQSIFPTVIAATVRIVPKRWMVVALLVHWFNPWGLTV